ncbi:MAG: acylphosphatase [Alphaproteobacteria bacterium]|nr:acylphosphatase [Alphaproteobacteria bacterium]
MKAVHAKIQGRVQGIGFRAWTEAEAHRRRLAGWVRNRNDGSVEAVFAGHAEDVDSMVNAVWKGPPGAKVDHVELDPASPPGTPGFEVLPTV